MSQLEMQESTYINIYIYTFYFKNTIKQQISHVEASFCFIPSKNASCVNFQTALNVIPRNDLADKWLNRLHVEVRSSRAVAQVIRPKAVLLPCLGLFIFALLWHSTLTDGYGNKKISKSVIYL